jgi:hypothetical protein
MATADRIGDRERDRLRRLSRLEGRDELGRSGGQGRAVADKDFLFIPALAADRAHSRHNEKIVRDHLEPIIKDHAAEFLDAEMATKVKA